MGAASQRFTLARRAIAGRLPRVRRRYLRDRRRGDHSDTPGRPPGARPGLIQMRPDLSEREELATLLHESFHEYFPYLEEWPVEWAAQHIAALLRREGWRLIREPATVLHNGHLINRRRKGKHPARD